MKHFEVASSEVFLSPANAANAIWALVSSIEAASMDVESVSGSEVLLSPSKGRQSELYTSVKHWPHEVHA